MCGRGVGGYCKIGKNVSIVQYLFYVLILYRRCSINILIKKRKERERKSEMEREREK